MRIALKFEVNYSDRGCPLHEGIPYFIATSVCGYGLKCSLALQWDTGYYEEDNLVFVLRDNNSGNRYIQARLSEHIAEMIYSCGYYFSYPL